MGAPWGPELPPPPRLLSLIQSVLLISSSTHSLLSRKHYLPATFCRRAHWWLLPNYILTATQQMANRRVWMWRFPCRYWTLSSLSLDVLLCACIPPPSTLSSLCNESAIMRGESDESHVDPWECSGLLWWVTLVCPFVSMELECICIGAWVDLALF